ncbi:MAG: TIGR00645 family protein [Gammaproteobacteria bacterium]|nr:TIGR00645 family protein [Gammaproteobacteria bacterium]
MRELELFIEKTLFASRWLLAPVYLGLSLAVLALGIKFFQELFHIYSELIVMKEADLVLMILSLIDLALVGALIVMVMFSGYENFVSRIDVGEDTDKLDWLGKLDANTLKLKVAASIVAISSIHLLRIFMETPRIFAQHGAEMANDRLFWYTAIHITFVISALLLALLDRIAFAAHRNH